VSSGAAAYAGADAAANSDLLTTLVGLAQPFGIFSPVELATGRPLFGNGAAGTLGTSAHPAGGAGGQGLWLIGTGAPGAPAATPAARAPASCLPTEATAAFPPWEAKGAAGRHRRLQRRSVRLTATFSISSSPNIFDELRRCVC
jgi:hypothetical protein